MLLLFVTQLLHSVVSILKFSNQESHWFLHSIILLTRAFYSLAYLTFNDIITLNASSVGFSTNQSTSLQSKIYDLQRIYARDSLVDSFNDLNQIAWYRSNVADDARHAAYLSVLPKNAYFIFSNEEMLILIRRLLYLDTHLHLPGISKCCNNPKHAYCDSKGTQMSVCAKGGYRIQTHDALNLEIQSHMFHKRRTRDLPD